MSLIYSEIKKFVFPGVILHYDGSDYLQSIKMKEKTFHIVTQIFCSFFFFW